MVELLTNGCNTEMNSVVTFMPKLDPFTMILLLPFMPAIAIMQLHMTMMNQLTQASQGSVQQQRTKVTSITRTGNTLDIIEKWV